MLRNVFAQIKTGKRYVAATEKWSHFILLIIMYL